MLQIAHPGESTQATDRRYAMKVEYEVALAKCLQVI